jgi:hypothetical protein
MIVTFLALLEMIRLKLVRVFQSGNFGEIRVYKRARPADAPRPIGDVSTHPHPAPGQTPAVPTQPAVPVRTEMTGLMGQTGHAGQTGKQN